MGKRELLLIAGFAVLGLAVYQLTAPPPAPGERGFSLARIVENVRREVGGNQASAEATTTGSHVVPDPVGELRVNVLRGPITIVGDDRETVDSELHVRSTGYDVAEATDLASQTVLKVEQIGSLLMARVEFPTPGRQTATLTLKVPSRLRVRIEGMTSRLEVSGVAAVEAAQAQGETTFRDIGGRVTASHRGGRLLVADAGSLKLTARGSTTTIDTVRGEAEITTQGGELTASGVTGPLELTTTATRVDLRGLLSRDPGSARIVVVGGGLTMGDWSAEARVDLRNAPLELHMGHPAEVAVFSEGNELVRIRAPAGGFRVDAHAREGRITSDPPDLFTTWGLAVETPGAADGQRLTGSIDRGGPLLTIRARRDIRFAVE
jgi:hypothetical protein